MPSYLKASNAVCFFLYSFQLWTWRKRWWKPSLRHGKYCWSFLLRYWPWPSLWSCPLQHWWSGECGVCLRSRCKAMCEPAMHPFIGCITTMRFHRTGYCLGSIPQWHFSQSIAARYVPVKRGCAAICLPFLQFPALCLPFPGQHSNCYWSLGSYIYIFSCIIMDWKQDWQRGRHNSDLYSLYLHQ